MHVHSLLLVAVFGGAASTFLEVFLKDRPVLEALRSSLAILQGSWFYQVPPSTSLFPILPLPQDSIAPGNTDTVD